jgi:hypothetical protein
VGHTDGLHKVCKYCRQKRKWYHNYNECGLLYHRWLCAIYMNGSELVTSVLSRCVKHLGTDTTEILHNTNSQA